MFPFPRNIFLLLLITLNSSPIALGNQFPSIVTFNEEYVGKALKFRPGGGSYIGDWGSYSGVNNGAFAKRSSQQSEEETPFVSILPICCSMETDDVMFFECQNNLSPSSKETLFKQKTWIAPKHLVSTKLSTKFRFENSFLKCRHQGFKTSFSLNSSTPRGSYFLLDGYLNHDNEYYRPDEYCISGLSKERVEVQICQVNCNDPVTPCIQKCCGRDQIYSFGYGDHPRGCVDAGGAKWSPTLYHNLGTRLGPQELITLNPHIIQKFPTSFKFNCRFNKTTVFPHGKEIAGFLSSFTQKPFRNLEFRLRKDGWLLYPNKEDNGSEIPVAKYIENYCIDGVQDYGESGEFRNSEDSTVLFLCSGGVDEAFDTKSQAEQSKPVFPSNAISTTSTRPPTVSTSTSSRRFITKMTTPKPSPEIEFESASSEISLSSPDFQDPEYTGNNLGQLLDPKLPKPYYDESLSPGLGSYPVQHLGQLLDPKLPKPYPTETGRPQVPVLSFGAPLPQVPKLPSSVSLPQEPKLSFGDQAPNLPSDVYLPPALEEEPVPKLPNPLYPIPQAVSILPKPNLAQILKKKPVAALSQTTFNHNNNHIHGSEIDHPGHGDSLINTLHGIPTCCNFSPDVNDGFTHHCRNRRMDLSTNGTGPGISYAPKWNVPVHFMTKDKGGSFLLNSVPLTCGHGKFQFQGFIHNFEQERANSPGEKKHGILADGFLKYDNEFYSPSEYCVNGLSPRIVEVLICKPDCSMWETPCLKKCCGLDEVYNLGLSSGNRGCQPLGQNEPKFSPTLYKDMATPLGPEEMKNIQVHFVQKFPPSFQDTCYNKITLAFPFSKEIAEKLTPADSAERGGVPFKHLKFRKDGKLIYTYPVSNGSSFDSVYERGEYCVDSVRDYGEAPSTGVSNPEYRDNQTILFICASQPH